MSKRKRIEQWQDMIARLYPELCNYDAESNEKTLSRVITFQVTDACNLACTYCYQINKGTRRMKFEYAKKLIDMLLEGDERLGGYVNVEKSPGIILEFIGGEPFLEVELIDQICTYFYDKAIELMHPWATKFCISICSNGVLYRTQKVQAFLNKWRDNMSFSVTIDGNKELHDACRIFPDGSPSYDLAVDAANDWMSKGYYMGSKITIAPENLKYMNDAIKHMVSLGYDEINANCVYEEGWTQEHAKEFYVYLKEIADYWNDNDLVKSHFLALFEDDFFRPKREGDDDNWCWGKGTPILTVDGYKPIEDIKIGDLVYTEDGSIHPVINTTSHFADNVVKISASGIFDLVCTDNHKLFVKPFDYIGWKYKKHYMEYGKYEVKDIEHNDLIKLFQLPDNNVVYDINLAYVIGRYIGDGWHSTTGYKICCAHEEEAELKKKLDNANIEYSIDNYPTVKQFNLFKSNTELIDILSRCGEGADSKHLPPECFNWLKDSLQSLVDGYMDADGAINKKEQYRFNTVSYTLAQELMVVLRTLGYTPTCYHNKRGGKSVILGRDVHVKDRYEVYYYKNSEHSKYVHEDNDGMWTYGLKTTKVEPQTVYNITVDTNHSYIAGGIASANCGGTGSMLSLDPDGYLYPCIRYMESSLGDEREPLRIGHVDEGIAQCDKCRKCVDMLNAITRKTQSTDECYYCPIAEGCSWCSAYNYQVNGTPDSRVTYICEMHKARALANVYFWNTYYRKHNIIDNETGKQKRFKNYCPDEWALNIISQEELDMLNALAKD